MEIEGKDGFKTLLKEGFKNQLGRGLGLDSNDRTVSRRHVSFELHTSDPEDETRVFFEVIGKNPIWVYNITSGGIRAFRRFERGEMKGGDMFCASAKKPFWFALKKIEFKGEDQNGINRELGFENELTESLQSSSGPRGVEQLELDSIDVSDIDPVKEFGFIVMGQEFDGYPNKMIRDVKNWEWFLEEPGEQSENDDNPERKGKKRVRRKRKKGGGNGDDDWTGESEDDKELISKITKKYSTRSQDSDKPTKDTSISKNSRQKKTPSGNEECIEDEDANTLGGFIVNDDDAEQE